MAETHQTPPTFADLKRKIETLGGGGLTQNETGENELDEIGHMVQDLEARYAEHSWYHTLFDLAPVGYLVLGAGTRILAVNANALNLLGTSRERILGEPLDSFLVPESRTVLHTHLTMVNELRATQSCRLRLHGRSPATAEVEAVGVLARERVNGEEYVLLTVGETTEHAERSKRLADLGRFSAWIAHELRQPLSSLKLAVYNTRKKCRDPDVLVHLQHADEKILEADQIINNVLAASMLKAPALQQTDLRKLIDRCIDETEDRMPTSHIRLVRKLDVLSAVRTTVDPDQIRQVARNLLQNACEALHETTGTIEVRGFADDESVGFTVTDNDDGIPEDDLEKVTDLFYTTKHRGFGMGLSLAVELVRMNGGALSIDSAAGKGTTVTVTLPRRLGSSDGEPPGSQ